MKFISLKSDLRHIFKLKNALKTKKGRILAGCDPSDQNIVVIKDLTA
ncbi:hypothetical protein EDF67_107234 [Sphingobacterium sp. JUb78]|nr:hypothetical protein [Sphingobacterium kitahiroshimense]TCR08445.1 hypothetical protein EDF67_107234 [Sphingobacterium sp. JUb78]